MYGISQWCEKLPTIPSENGDSRQFLVIVDNHELPTFTVTYTIKFKRKMIVKGILIKAHVDNDDEINSIKWIEINDLNIQIRVKIILPWIKMNIK